MTIPKKLYEILKFLVDFGTSIVTVVSGILLAFGVGDALTNKVVLCISGACTIITVFIKVCSKNHWKAVAEDGTTEEIKPIEEEEN